MTALPPLPASLRSRYRAERVLGRGGMGVALLARDLELDRPVVIKLAGPDVPADIRRRALREGELLAGLQHPHVLQVYGAGDSEQGPYLVTEYLAGGTLVDRLGEFDVVPVFTQLAAALDAVHEAGLVHRDLKPENVLLTEEGRAVLADFGVAQDPSRTRLTATGKVVGTLAFMAPEVLAGRKPGPPCDWFGWGATLFAVLEGRPPYPEDARMKHILEDAPLQLEFSEVPPGRLRDALRATLHPDPARRLAPTAALRGEGPAPPGAHTGRFSPPVTTPSRRRLWVPLVGGLLLFGVGFLGPGASSDPDPEPPPGAAGPGAPQEPDAEEAASAALARRREALQAVFDAYPLGEDRWPGEEEARFYGDLVSLRLDVPLRRFLDAAIAWLEARPAPRVDEVYRERVLLPVRRIATAYRVLENRVEKGPEVVALAFGPADDSLGPPPEGWDPEAVTARGRQLRARFEAFLCELSERGLDVRADAAHLAVPVAKYFGLLGGSPRHTPEACAEAARARPRRWADAMLDRVEGGAPPDEAHRLLGSVLGVVDHTFDAGLLPLAARRGVLERVATILDGELSLSPWSRVELEGGLLRELHRAVLYHQSEGLAALRELLAARRERFASLAPGRPDHALHLLESIRRFPAHYPYLDASVLGPLLRELAPLERSLRALRDQGEGEG